MRRPATRRRSVPSRLCAVGIGLCCCGLLLPTTAAALLQPGYLQKHCPIAVTVVGAVNSTSAISRHKAGLSVQGVRTQAPLDGFSVPAVKYTWQLSNRDTFCGIVGTQGGKPVSRTSFTPTTVTARSGSYIDWNVNTPNPLDENEQFTVYAKPVAPRASRSSRPGAELSLTGPLTNLKLCAPYAYTVTVRASKSYHEAVVTLDAPAATVPYQPRTVNLKAGRPWTGRFTLYFNRPEDMSQGLLASVSVLPPRHGYVGLHSRRYMTALAPGQSEAPRPPGSCGPVPAYFGS